MPSRLLLALLFLLAACNNDYCARHTDCAANQMCSIEGKCVAATSDTTGDAGTDDANPTAIDAAPAVDAPTPDAAVDAGEAP